MTFIFCVGVVKMSQVLRRRAKITWGPPTHVKFNPRVQFFILFHLPTLWLVHDGTMTHNESSEKKVGVLNFKVDKLISMGLKGEILEKFL